MSSERDGPPPAATDLGFRITLVGATLVAAGVIQAVDAIVEAITGGDPVSVAAVGGGLATMGCLILAWNGGAFR